MNDRSAVANPWADIIGPCYTTESMARTFGWTEAEVTDAADSLAVLGLVTDDGVVLYPQFQLSDGRVVDGLAEILRVLRTGINDPWTWAQFLNTHLPDEDGIEQPNNVELLRAGYLDDVLREAEHDAAAWRA